MRLDRHGRQPEVTSSGRPRAQGRTVLITLAALFSTGWASNHFTSLLPVLADVAHISKPGLDIAFGIYALGLLPALLLGGGVSDRTGRRRVVLAGLTLSTAGNLMMLLWPTLAGVLAGRLIVGLGVGLVMSAGTAWAADQNAAKGAARAGITLTAGFAAGPLASGVIADVVSGSGGLILSFGLSVLLTGLSVVFCAAASETVRSVGTSAALPAPGSEAQPDDRRLGRALAAALPMGLWVFTCIVIAMVVLTVRLGSEYGGPLLPAIAADLGLGSGLLVQLATRRMAGWRPLGIIGALLAATAFILSGLAGARMSIGMFVLCSVVFGCAYGLCLGQGLRDVEALAPPSSRGVVTGIFYVITYSGYGLPFLLNTYEDRLGATRPMLILAALALASALLRASQLLRDRAARSEPRAA